MAWLQGSLSSHRHPYPWIKVSRSSPKRKGWRRHRNGTCRWKNKKKKMAVSRSLLLLCATARPAAGSGAGSASPWSWATVAAVCWCGGGRGGATAAGQPPAWLFPRLSQTGAPLTQYPQSSPVPSAGPAWPPGRRQRGRGAPTPTTTAWCGGPERTGCETHKGVVRK